VAPRGVMLQCYWTARFDIKLVPMIAMARMKGTLDGGKTVMIVSPSVRSLFQGVSLQPYRLDLGGGHAQEPTIAPGVDVKTNVSTIETIPGLSGVLATDTPLKLYMVHLLFWPAAR
jgi:hypothetical protein